MKPTEHHTPARPRRGFTIMEVVITFIIIGVLVLILVPAVSNRARDARITAATQDVEHIKDAQERAAIDTSYMYRLYALDDSYYGDGTANTAVGDRLEGLSDNFAGANTGSGNPITYDNPSFMFIQPNLQNFAGNQQAIFNRATNPTNETSFNWRGPYLNWQRDVNNNDWPDDPWGNDYLFFTFYGVLYPPQTNTGNDFSDEFQDRISLISGEGTVENWDAEIFGRPTILSLGPDGAPGDGSGPSNTQFGQGDDIYVQFGGNGFNPQNPNNNP